MSTLENPRGYEPWADQARRLSREAEIGFNPGAADQAARDPEHVAQWLRANCLDFRDLSDAGSSLTDRRAIADRIRGIAAHFLAITGGDYVNEGNSR